MFGVSFTELVVIGLVVLVVFGPEKLPELARTLGTLLVQLRKLSEEVKTELHKELYPPMQEFKNSIDTVRQESAKMIAKQFEIPAEARPVVEIAAQPAGLQTPALTQPSEEKKDGNE